MGGDNKIMVIRRANKIEKISFRDQNKKIPSTTYGAFGLYRYPAKFIPQVISFILEEYGHRNTKVIDPFAGSGTTGLVSRIYGFDYELWDLNPMVKLLHEVAVTVPIKINPEIIVKRISRSRKRFIPSWPKLSYWFPEKVIPLLFNIWGFYHTNTDPKMKKILLIPLLKITRKYSYNDHQRQKLSRSPISIKKVHNLIKKINWKEEFYKDLSKEIGAINKKLKDFRQIQILNPPHSLIRSGIDCLEESKKLKKNNKWNFLITSPPYLQAQEYIRNSKMDLFWLDYSEDKIKELAQKEFPYKKVEEIAIKSPLYNKFRKQIKEEHLRKMYERYFNGVLGSLTNLSKNVSEYLFLFVGLASVRGIPIPIDKIFIEHFKKLGWKHKKTYVDSIVSRVLFKTKVNPATGLKDNRILTERLVIMKRL